MDPCRQFILLFLLGLALLAAAWADKTHPFPVRVILNSHS